MNRDKFDLPQGPANYAPLSPLSFIARAASVYPDHVAIIHGEHRASWLETYTRCRRLASALVRQGVGKSDTVAFMAPNTPAMVEAHFGVAMAGAVLNALNIRLDAEMIGFILGHSETRVLLVDREFSGTIAKALATMPDEARPLVIDIDDALAPPGDAVGKMDYEAFLASGDPAFLWSQPDDEWDAISLNYTSGTTGNPKGVVYHHRGAYLNAIGNALTWSMAEHPVYLWTLPMFHCNGWCFPWTVAALAGTNVCLRRVEAVAMKDAMDWHGVTHLSGAPVVMGMLLNVPNATPRAVRVRMMTAGAAPPAAVLQGMEALGFDVVHVYGLTETYGPVTVCAWQDAWDTLDATQRARIKSRQGVAYVVQEGLMVGDAETLQPCPQDGASLGEIFMRGNIVMKGYLKNPAATEEAFAGGWFHTGDLAVWHGDGYIEIKDRSKDIIISGGENISTIEVESVLYQHPAVLEAAVVARPDATWGETPCAFVTLRPEVEATEAEIIAFCRDKLARFKVPKTVVFGPLPKTSTGKMQKNVLRDRVREL